MTSAAMASQVISRTFPRRKSGEISAVLDAETCPSDCKRLTPFMMGSPSVAADETWKVAEGRFCSPGDHLSAFNIYRDASFIVA